MPPIPKAFSLREFNISEKMGPSVGEKGSRAQEIMQNYRFTQILFKFGRPSPEFRRWFNEPRQSTSECSLGAQFHAANASPCKKLHRSKLCP